MSKADLSEIKTRVSEVARQSALSQRLGEITLEADQDEEGSDFLRVIVEVKQLDDVSDAEIEDLQALQASIEDAVGIVDDRFPSIRFDDAA